MTTMAVALDRNLFLAYYSAANDCCCIRYFSTHFTSVDQWRRPPPFHRLVTVTGVVVQSGGGGNSRPCVPWFADPCLQRKLESALFLRPGWRTHRTCSPPAAPFFFCQLCRYLL